MKAVSLKRCPYEPTQTFNRLFLFTLLEFWHPIYHPHRPIHEYPTLSTWAETHQATHVTATPYHPTRETKTLTHHLWTPSILWVLIHHSEQPSYAHILGTLLGLCLPLRIWHPLLGNSPRPCLPHGLVIDTWAQTFCSGQLGSPPSLPVMQTSALLCPP